MISILIPCKEEPEIVSFIEKVEKEFPFAQIVIANDRYGRGKGWAMREALSQAEGNRIVFLDGDGDINPSTVRELLQFDNDAVVGKKEIRGLLSRKILTVLSRFYIKILFGIKVDSQTGVKVFKRDALPDWKCNSFSFDIEILSKIKDAKEVTVEANITRKMKFHSVWLCFIESLKLKLGLLQDKRL